MRKIVALIFAVFSLIGWCAHASIVLNGTRVILTAGSTEKTVKLTNPDSHPYLVQAWVSSEPAGDSSEITPLFVTPPIFKIPANQGQFVRLLLSGDELPQDRESIFYFNFSQIPATSASVEHANRLVVLIKSSVKVFVRPGNLKEDANLAPTSLRFSVDNSRLILRNPTPFHISVNRVKMENKAGSAQELAAPLMLKPFSESFVETEFAPESANLRIFITAINDFGASVEHEVLKDSR